jgi:AcrR family transcriptional regulator
MSAGPSNGNADRSQRTRERLLVAAVDTLIDKGYAATTVAAVQARAGLSRGALLHHYPTKAGLLLEAVEFLADTQLEELDVRAVKLAAAPEADLDRRTQLWLDLMWSSFASRLFVAVLELWIAARTEPDLRDQLIPYERRLGARLRRVAATLLGPDMDQAQTKRLFSMTLVYYRGLAVSGLLDMTPKAQRALLAEWRDVVAPPSGSRSRHSGSPAIQSRTSPLNSSGRT